MADIRTIHPHHYLHIDDGALDHDCDGCPSHATQLQELMASLERFRGGDILLYAHGGLNAVADARKRAIAWRECFSRNNIHEIHFIWETGFWATLLDLLRKKFLGHQKGLIDDETRDWLIEKACDGPGHEFWRDMQDDARDSFANTGAGGMQFLHALKACLGKMEDPPRIHLAGHSAGAIFFGHMLSAWQALAMPKLGSVTLMAPACTHEFFVRHYEPLLGTHIDRIHMPILSDEDEQKDKAKKYRKSLLYLVSRAFEQPGTVVPLLGMEVSLGLLSDRARPVVDHYHQGSHPLRTGSRSHGGFDTDLHTMNQLLTVIKGHAPKAGFELSDLRGYDD